MWSGSDIQQVGLWRGVANIAALVPPRRKRQFCVLLGLMFLNALAELASIGAVVPLLALLADPEGMARFPWALNVLGALGASSEGERLVAATLVFIAFVSLAGAFRLQLAWLTQDFVYSVGHDISVEVQRRILSQPYAFHVQTNSSTLLAGVEKTEQLTYTLLLPLMQALIAAFLSLFIIIALVYIHPLVAGVTALTFFSMYALISKLTRRRLQANSNAVADAWDTRLQTVQESLGGIRDVIIDGSRDAHLGAFARASRRLKNALSSNAFIASAPRSVIETAGMVVIALIALFAARQPAGFTAAVPILGAVALGAQRLLPLLQQIYAASSTFTGSSAVLAQVSGLLQLPIRDEGDENGEPEPLQLQTAISLRDVSFTYPSRRRPAVDRVNMEIPAGSSVALVGATGSGKSTLGDLIMGLLEPTSGTISIDGHPLTGRVRRRWQRCIAHVPQAIFLADTTIAQNIGLARNDSGVDLDRVVAAARRAQLHEFVSALPDGYETLVGERGVRLSGGQRQRLGIARALYKEAQVLVLDEATSALDEQTEAAVMDGLYELDREACTMIVIAHRPSTIKRCDLVVKIHEGRVVDHGRFTDVMIKARLSAATVGDAGSKSGAGPMNSGN